MKKIVNLLGHGLFYTFAVSIESIAPFVLAPVLTHYLTVYDYGIWAIFQAACAFLRPVLGLAMDDYVRMRHHHHSRERMVGSLIAIIGLSGLISIASCGIMMIFAAPLSQLLHFPQNWFWSIVLCAWLHAMFYMLLAFYQFESQKPRFAMVHFIQAMGTLTFSILLVISGWGWAGAVLGKIGGLLCGCLLAIFWIGRTFPANALSHVRRATMAELASFGWRYLPNGMVFVVIILTDRLLLANLVSVDAASLFAVASLFPMVLMTVIQGYIFGWQPWCFKRLQTPNRKDTPELAAGAGLFFIGLPIGSLILAFVSQWFGPYIIGPHFNDAFTYILPLCLAMAAQGYYYFLQSILQFYHRLSALSWIAACTMAANLILNFILIARYGTLGSCWATLIAYMLAFGLTAAVALSTLRKQYIVSLNKESQGV